jgi:hypothetical protein
MTEPPIGYVRLSDAVDTVGRKLKGAQWHQAERVVGPYNRRLTDPAEPDPAFEEVIIAIAMRCEAGEIIAAYRTVDGGVKNLDRSVWQRPQWRNYFVAGMIELDLPLLGSTQTTRHAREIYLRQQEVDRFVETLRRAKPREAAARVSEAKVRRAVEQYLAATVAPSEADLVGHIKNTGLSVTRARLRTEYRNQRPHLRRGRPLKTSPK